MVEGFNTHVTADVLNLPDKRVNPDSWLRSGFESPRRQLGFKPLSGSHQLRTLHCRATLIIMCLIWGANNILRFPFPFPSQESVLRRRTLVDFSVTGNSIRGGRRHGRRSVSSRATCDLQFTTFPDPSNLRPGWSGKTF